MAAMHNNNTNEEANLPMETLPPPPAAAAAAASQTDQPAASATLVQIQGRKNPPPPLPEDVDRLNPKRLKRMEANRLYSHRYRNKQSNYIVELEDRVKSLQDEIAINIPQIPYLHNRKSVLESENNFLKQKIHAYTEDLHFKEAQHKELKKEQEDLKQQVYPNLVTSSGNNSETELTNVDSSQPSGSDSMEE